MSASLTATWVEQNQCPLHQSILLTQGPIREIFMKKHWELVELENEVFWPFWIFQKRKKELLHLKENKHLVHMNFIFFCTMDGLFRILEKRLSKLICTQLYYLPGSLPSLCCFRPPHPPRLPWPLRPPRFCPASPLGLLKLKLNVQDLLPTVR